MSNDQAALFRKPSYSWEGEDLLVAKLCSDYLRVEDGFYVDVGAHHPFAMSNTALLYEKGWSGVNIDAMPGAMELFNTHRPRDVNISCGVGKTAGLLAFSVFTDPALNGFLSEHDRRHHIQRGCMFVRELFVPVRPLNEILREAVGDKPIDFMNIDAEGLDLEVIQSNDWGKYRPTLICTETLGASDIRSVLMHPIARQLESLNYTLLSRLHFSSIFIDKRCLR